MYRLIKICLVALLSVCFFNAQARKVQPDDGYDIFLLIGQSNMAGRGHMIDGDEDVIGKNVFILDDNGEIVPARNPLNQYSSIRKDMSMQRICPGYGFAKKLSKKTKRKILLVVNARGGTTMDQWAKGSEEGYYEEAVRRTRQAMKYGTLKAILWHQGCGDSRKSKVYMGKLSAFVSSMREDLNADVPFIAGELGQWRPIVNDFNAMIHTISANIPNSDWVSSEGCIPIVTKRSNGEPDLKDPHFDRNSQILLGHRYADKVMKMCYGKKQ